MSEEREKLLKLVMVSQVMVLPSYATELPETSTEIEVEMSEMGTDESETINLDETEFDTGHIEDGGIDAEETESIDAYKEKEETQDSEDLPFTTESEEIIKDKHRITGFKALTDSKRYYVHEMKPSEKEIVTDFPEFLEVYLDNTDTIYEMPVKWKGIGNYDNTEFYYYEFDPIWDETICILDTNDEIPYIGVYLDTPQVMSVSGYDNETVIYEYLTQKMGLNTAAASGVLANIKCESDFNPNAPGIM